MIELADILFSRTSVLAVAVAITTATYALVAMRFVRTFSQHRASRRDKFFKALDRSFEIGSLNSLQDVVRLHNGIFGAGSEDEYGRGVVVLLEQYLVHITLSDLDSDFINKCKIKIETFIGEEKSESPFSGLPDNERHILRDLKRYMTLGDHEAVDEKINELSASVISRQDTISQLQGAAKWSIPLAVVGLILTVIFGITSIVFAIS